jgi:hypothetical protein
VLSLPRTHFVLVDTYIEFSGLYIEFSAIILLSQKIDSVLDLRWILCSIQLIKIRGSQKHHFSLARARSLSPSFDN